MNINQFLLNGLRIIFDDDARITWQKFILENLVSKLNPLTLWFKLLWGRVLSGTMAWRRGCRRIGLLGSLSSWIGFGMTAFLIPFWKPSYSFRRLSKVLYSGSGRPFRTWFFRCSASFRSPSSRSGISKAACCAPSLSTSVSRSNLPPASSSKRSFHFVASESV